MTKVQLLQHISEADIFAKYIPGFNPASSKNYKSPFGTADNKPSLAIYNDATGLKFKSHNTGHQGDAFQFVADLKKLDCKNNFDAVIQAITKDFSINGFSASPAKPHMYTPPSGVGGKKNNIKISFEKAPTVQMLSYFDKYKIDLETLMRFNVNQVKYHEFISSAGKLCKFDYRKSKQLAICYQVSDKIKIYFPAIEGIQEKSFGFKEQTTADIFAFSVITEQHYENLFITAGEKDCLALNANGFAAISFQSENTIPTQSQIKVINLLADSIFIVYDNDTAGQNAATKICKLTNWQSLQLPEGFKDAAEFFAKNTKEDFQNIINDFQKSVLHNSPSGDGGSDEETPAWTVFHQAEKYLNKKYRLRYNSIKLELEIAPLNEGSFKPLNENSLFVEMNKAGIKIGIDKLISILKSDFVTQYNPLIDYFKNLPKWDGKTNHIQKLCSFIDCIHNEDFYTQFSKWMMRAVKCATIEGYYNKQAFILVHHQQNSGKTSFCRFLCPPALAEYFAENISDDKDSRIAIAKNFIINLDELSSLHKSEINSLKALFSKDIINERLPYDRKTSIIHRVSSFIGSTNMAEFLTDETGSVRWLCFEIKNINWAYRHEVDINQCWAQAIAMIKDGLPAEMCRDEIDQNENRNSKFQQRSAEAEIIPKFFAPAAEMDQGSVFMSATEILMHLCSQTTVKLNKIMVGRAMPVNGFVRVKDAHTDRYGYWVTKI